MSWNVGDTLGPIDPASEYRLEHKKRSNPRIGILNFDARQAPFVVLDEHGHWRIWLIYNPDVTAGTYLQLYPSGLVERVTIGPDGSIADIVRITGPVANQGEKQ